MNKYSGSYYINSQISPKNNKPSYLFPELSHRDPRYFIHFMNNLTYFYINSLLKQAKKYPRQFIHFLYNFSFKQNLLSKGDVK